MPSIAIISKPQKPELATILPELRVWLKQHGYADLLDPMSAAYIGSAKPCRGTRCMSISPSW